MSSLFAAALKVNRFFPAEDNRGFTLIELIVVISLLGVILFFAVPRLNESFFASDSRKLSTWLQLNVKELKNRAVEKQLQYILYVDFDDNRLWTGHESMDEQALEAAQSRGFPLSTANRLSAVIFAGQNRISTQTARIRFYPQGYSDHAVIHVETRDHQQISYEIQSFLPGIRIGGGRG